MEILESKKEHLGALFLEGFIAAHNSHELLFKTIREENRKQEKLSVSLVYLSNAYTNFKLANEYILANLDVLEERQEFTDTFVDFNSFNREFLRSAATDHSHSHTDNYFLKFADSFKNAASILDIDKENFFYNLATDNS